MWLSLGACKFPLLVVPPVFERCNSTHGQDPKPGSQERGKILGLYTPYEGLKLANQKNRKLEVFSWKLEENHSVIDCYLEAK